MQASGQDVVRGGGFGVVALLLASVVLGGCAAIHANRFSPPPANPQVLHGPLNVQRAGSCQEPTPIDRPMCAAYGQFKSYYDAMDAASTCAPPTECGSTLSAYVDAGIGFVDSNCRRWFGAMDEFSRRLAERRSDHGVLSQLGTALIGVGQLNADVTAVYGAFSTAWLGSLSGAEALYLIAPSVTNVENKVFGHLVDRAKEMRSTSYGTMHQARGALEAYARICTWKHARELVEKAVDQADTKAAPDGSVTLLSYGADTQSRILRDLWKPDGSHVDIQVDHALRFWLQENAPGMQISELIHSDEYADLRSRAVPGLIDLLRR